MTVRSHVCFALAFAALASSAVRAGAVSTQDLARCVAIAVQDARLACYDALAHRVTSATSVPAPTTPAVSAVAPVSTATTAVSPYAPQPAAIAEDPKDFGLSAAQQHVEKLQVKSEQAQIVSIARGEPGQAVIVLDNGQSWKVSGADDWISNGNKVTIKRASLGSFLMHTPSKHAYTVRRIN